VAEGDDLTAKQRLLTRLSSCRPVEVPTNPFVLSKVSPAFGMARCTLQSTAVWKLFLERGIEARAGAPPPSYQIPEGSVRPSIHQDERLVGIPKPQKDHPGDDKTEQSDTANRELCQTDTPVSSIQHCMIHRLSTTFLTT
jgi:hypothetical protein